MSKPKKKKLKKLKGLKELPPMGEAALQFPDGSTVKITGAQIGFFGSETPKPEEPIKPADAHRAAVDRMREIGCAGPLDPVAVLVLTGGLLAGHAVMVREVLMDEDSHGEFVEIEVLPLPGHTP